MAEDSQFSLFFESQSNLFLRRSPMTLFLYDSLRALHLRRITFSHRNLFPVADPAAMAIVFYTARADFFFEASPILLPKKLSGNPRFDESPLKGLLEVSPVVVEIHPLPRTLKGRLP